MDNFDETKELDDVAKPEIPQEQDEVYCDDLEKEVNYIEDEEVDTPVAPTPQVIQPEVTPNVTQFYYEEEPKKKKGLGIKILLWVIAVTLGISLFGSGFYLGLAVKGNNYPDILPPIVTPNPSSQPDIEDPTITIPDIDVPQNNDGIVLNKVPQTGELKATEIYKKAVKSIVKINASWIEYDGSLTEGVATGIIISEDGFIVTNSHVINDTKEVEVKITTNDGVEHEAVVVGFDKATDLAVLKMNGNGFEIAEFGSSADLEMGQDVIAIGNPSLFEGSITKGIISGLNRTLNDTLYGGVNYIQTDTTANPGNSGGPLLNMYGQVVGVVGAKMDLTVYENTTLVIPTVLVQKIVNDIMQDGVVSGRVRLGISARPVTSNEAAAGIPYGIKIENIDEVSSFTGTDAKVADIIISVDNSKVYNTNQLYQLFMNYNPGDTADVELCRLSLDGSTEYFHVTITFLEDKGETLAPPQILE